MKEMYVLMCSIGEYSERQVAVGAAFDQISTVQHLCEEATKLVKAYEDNHEVRWIESEVEIVPGKPEMVRRKSRIDRDLDEKLVASMAALGRFMPKLTHQGMYFWVETVPFFTES